MKGHEGLGFEYTRSNPILHELLHGGNMRASSSHDCANNSHGHEGECINVRDSDNSLHKVTNDAHLVNKCNMIPENGKRDPHAAAHKGNLDVVEILLERDASAKNPDPIGWTQKAVVKQLKNKIIPHQILSYENENKSDEYRVEIVEPEILNLGGNDSARNCRKDGIRPVNFPLKKLCTNSSSINSNSFSDREAARFIKKRVTIHLPGRCRSTSQGQHGKLIILPDSLEELLKISGML